jgi:hypothetical protein
VPTAKPMARRRMNSIVASFPAESPSENVEANGEPLLRHRIVLLWKPSDSFGAQISRLACESCVGERRVRALALAPGSQAP